MALSIEQVHKLAELARLELAADAAPKLADQLNAIFTYIDQLGQLAIDNVEPLAHPLPVQNVFRADDPQPSLPADVALANAPNRAGDFFAVPAILD
jgi:aspartyl-tRNA(Asn)/glutamyl-tRNA(Gln) amidotransferase subunit C